MNWLRILVVMVALPLCCKGEFGFTRVRSFGLPERSAQYPEGRVILGSDGRLYGTTLYGGGFTHGTVFGMNTDGTGFAVLHGFGATTNDGRNPYADVIEASDGALYGTTWHGGDTEHGIIFKVNKDGSGYRIVRSLGPESAGQPPSELFEASDGRLYGTAFDGGDFGSGTVFRLAKDGNGFEIIKHFGAYIGDGRNPTAGVIQGSDGRIYGTTANGGTLGGFNGNGTVFAMEPNGSNYAVLVNFGGSSGGQGPLATVTEARHGVLYGTTAYGGTSGRGVLFKVNKDGSDFAVLRNFSSLSSGATTPQGVLIQASDGNFYGTANRGGQAGQGAIFRFSTNATLGFTRIQNLGVNPGDGAQPTAGLVEGPGGTLYGTSFYGGTSGYGAVFKLQKDGGGYATLFSGLYGGGDGDLADSAMILGSDGMLYGTSSYGGIYNIGTVFRLNTNGGNYEVIHHFVAGTDGASPSAGIIEGSDGRLYGTTVYTGGIPGGNGIIYGLNKDGSGYAILHQFGPGVNSGSEWTGLMEASDGRLYGVTFYGGNNGAGSIFRLEKSGFNFETVFHIPSTPGSPYSPRGELMEGPDGLLYGTTFFGGSNGFGTVFKLQKDGTGFQVIKDFGDVAKDAHNPKARLCLGADDVLYGTSYNGGLNEGGAVFKLNRDGSGYAVVKEFSGLDGTNLYSGVIEGPDGALYGTTFIGGPADQGTAFRLTKDGLAFSVLRAFDDLDSNGARPSAGLLRVGNALYGVTAGGGQYGLGTIYKLAPPVSSEITLEARRTAANPGGAVDLVLSGPLGISYRIEFTESLSPGSSWQTLTNLTLVKGSAIATDADAAFAQRRFYRAGTGP